ncbi:TIGR01841 family phasin [Lacisediminimonas profundi]|uniref:TIGR01841 family phasin n=1 Tax=Lacisediminimonas profundi TaxID=2603856 RepID=UPI00124B0F99|nr:TIGR01841 family phasin [Lacisediminimonas profundi]
MLSYQEQLSNATRSQMEATLALMTNLTTRTFEGVEKFIELNLTVAKTSLEESTAAVQQLLAAKDPQSFFSLTTAQAQPNAEKALAYGRHLATIASSLQAEFTKATEAQIADANHKVVALVEEISKNAPAGSENAVAFLKSAIGNASAGYEQLSKSAKQAVEAMEGNIASATAQMTQAAAKASGRSAKK